MNKSSRGFTLMEMIGVMAVLAILASVLAPSVFDTIDRAVAEAEEKNLSELGDALVSHILTTKNVPLQNRNSWVPALTVYTSYPAEQTEFNQRGFRRRLYVDPRFFGTTDASFPGYTQTTGLVTFPNSPRLMLISNVKGNVPGPTNSSADFDAIWDQTASAPVLEDKNFKVHRINLRQYFHRVLLTNANTQQPGYGLETQTAQPVPGAVGGVDGTLIRYVLQDTQLRLFSTPYPAGGLSTSVLVKGEFAARYSTDGSSWFWETL